MAIRSLSCMSGVGRVRSRIRWRAVPSTRADRSGRGARYRLRAVQGVMSSSRRSCVRWCTHDLVGQFDHSIRICLSRTLQARGLRGLSARSVQHSTGALGSDPTISSRPSIRLIPRFETDISPPYALRAGLFGGPVSVLSADTLSEPVAFRLWV